MFRARLFALAVLALLLSITCLRAEGDWPAGLVVQENSESPDGKYGVLVPNVYNYPEGEEDKAPNTLVNLQTHERLAVIRNSHYLAHMNHAGSEVTWAPDSSWCAVIYTGRFDAFLAVTLLEVRGGKITQSDVGAHIQKALDAVYQAGLYATAYFRPGAGRQVLVRGTALNDPKGMRDKPMYNASFEGTFDLASQKWVRSQARAMKRGEDGAVNSAYVEFSTQNATFPSEDDELETYDNAMNSTYSALRQVLPAKRCAAVKKEQIAWLKQLETQDTPRKKITLIGERIKELVRVAWQ